MCGACAQEFNIEKLHLLEAEKAKIRKDFERREGQIEVKKKIEFSKQLNASRIKARRAFRHCTAACPDPSRSIAPLTPSLCWVELGRLYGVWQSVYDNLSGDGHAGIITCSNAFSRVSCTRALPCLGCGLARGISPHQ